MSVDNDFQRRAIDRRSLLVGMGATAIAFTPLSSAGGHEGHENHGADKKHDHHHECREYAEACETTIAAVQEAFG